MDWGYAPKPRKSGFVWNLPVHVLPTLPGYLPCFFFYRLSSPLTGEPSAAQSPKAHAVCSGSVPATPSTHSGGRHTGYLPLSPSGARERSQPSRGTAPHPSVSWRTDATPNPVQISTRSNHRLENTASKHRIRTIRNICMALISPKFDVTSFSNRDVRLPSQSALRVSTLHGKVL